MTKEQRQYSGAKRSSTNGGTSTGHPPAKEKRIETQNLTSFTNINSKWIRDLNVNTNLGNSLRQHRGKPNYIGYDDACLGNRPKPRLIKEIIDKLNFIKIKNFLFFKIQCQENEKTSHRLGADIYK